MRFLTPVPTLAPAAASRNNTARRLLSQRRDPAAPLLRHRRPLRRARPAFRLLQPGPGSHRRLLRQLHASHGGFAREAQSAADGAALERQRAHCARQALPRA
jgi:hypothetical protein